MGNIKNNAIRAKLLPMIGCVLILLICAAPCSADIIGFEFQEVYPSWNVDSGIYYNKCLIVDGILNLKEGAEVGAVTVLGGGIVNMEPGANVLEYLYVDPGATLIVRGGSVGYLISLPEYSTSTYVEVHGYDFAVDDESYEGESFIPDGTSILTGCYQNGTPFFLVFEGGVLINLVPSTPSVAEIAIDIKPGSDTNPINPKSKGLVPVAILGTDDFDVANLEFSTIVLKNAVPPEDDEEEIPTVVHPVRWTMEDVNGDGIEDMLLHFTTQDLVTILTEDTTEATLTLIAEMNDSEIEASDTVHIVPSKK